jgi:Co/Zn/Cd efflux system component
MPKMRLVVTVMVLVAVVIVGEAVYAFSRPDHLELSQAIVLIGIAILALIVLMGTLFVVWKGMNKTGKNNTNNTNAK